MSANKDDVLLRFRNSGVVPVFYHPDIDVLLRVITICYESGLRVFEFMHQRDNRGLRFFMHLHDQLHHYPDLMLGVGTVLDGTMTERYIAAGAKFIASPFLRPDMGRICHAHDVLWMPGCATSEEADLAAEQEARAISVLPGNILGPEFIAPIARRYPHMALLPSGISDLRESSLSRWFESGAYAIKIGPQIFTKENLVAQAWGAIGHDLDDLVRRVKQIPSWIHPSQSLL